MFSSGVVASRVPAGYLSPVSRRKGMAAVDASQRGACAMMRSLLLLAFMAVASDAMAQDAQCVRERAAMVETIRAYARSNADGLERQDLSESVLDAMGRTERHRFIPGRSCSVAYMDGPVPIGRDQTIS